jgi:predicted nucleic acid-binding protein
VINYLILIDRIDLLHRLYGSIIIPTAVRAELTDSRAPEAVRSWISSPPDWIEVREAPPIHDPSLLALDPGEREVLALA